MDPDLLNDVSAPCASSLLREEAGRRVIPENAPGVETRIVDPERCAVPVAGTRKLRSSRPAVLQPRDHPYVLDRATFQHPAGVDLAPSGMSSAVLGQGGDVHFPASDEPRVESELRRAFGVGPFRVQHFGERGGSSVRRARRSVCRCHRDHLLARLPVVAGASCTRTAPVAYSCTTSASRAAQSFRQARAGGWRALFIGSTGNAVGTKHTAQSLTEENLAPVACWPPARGEAARAAQRCQKATYEARPPASLPLTARVSRPSLRASSHCAWYSLPDMPCRATSPPPLARVQIAL